MDIKASRWKTVVVGGVAGFALAAYAGTQFESFFENFLLALDYWITPWLAIVLVDFYVTRQTTVEVCLNPVRWVRSTIVIYLFSIGVSVPFMVPAASLPYPVGALSGIFGGADFSYFISFAVAAALQFAVGRRRSPHSVSLLPKLPGQ